MNLSSDLQRMKSSFVDERRIRRGILFWKYLSVTVENAIQAQGCKIVPDLICGGIVCSIYDYVLGSLPSLCGLKLKDKRSVVLLRLLTNTAWWTSGVRLFSPATFNSQLSLSRFMLCFSVEDSRFVPR